MPLHLPPAVASPHSSKIGRVLVLQNGARHNYAVPQALAQEGMLSGFYTDACGNVGLGRIARFFTRLPRFGPAFQRLASRQIPRDVRPLTRSFHLSSLSEIVDPEQSHPRTDRWFAKAMQRAGLRGASLIYSSMGWPPAFLSWARQHGIPVVSECYVHPMIWRTHQAEHRLFPGWEPGLPYATFSPENPPHRKVFDVSDFILAPSESVRREIIAESLFPADRTHVIPYGISKSFFEIENRPIPGRVLYVGSVSLAKGIQYLAQASQEIAIREPDLDIHFQVAGNVRDTIRNQPRCSRLEFLGRLPRTEVARLYETADVLVFPTLSDSFGAVVLEAMAAGIPVICSPYCTDAVQDSISGFVVEPRDTALLAKTIARVIGDRDLRHRLSEAARKRASEFTWDRHRSSLTATLRQIHKQRSAPHALQSLEVA